LANRCKHHPGCGQAHARECDDARNHRACDSGRRDSRAPGIVSWSGHLQLEASDFLSQGGINWGVLRFELVRETPQFGGRNWKLIACRIWRPDLVVSS